MAALAGAGLSSRAPTVPDITRPKAPPLVRRGDAGPDIRAESALIQRLSGGETLFGRMSRERVPIASLTKLMTALVLAENTAPLESVEFSAEAKRFGTADENRSAVAAGERLKAEDVTALIIIPSANDAAYAAAEHVALRLRPELASRPLTERIAAFVALMNERAQALGLPDTHFANPAGSDDPENYSTAEDLARLAAHIAGERPEIFALSRTREAFAFGAGGRRYSLVNTNPLLAEFPAMYASKTGFEDQARGTLLMLYQIARGDFVAIVLLRSPDRFADGRSAIGWLEANFSVESR